MAKKILTSSKWIVSNRTVLLAKYGAPGVKAIETAMQAMIKADKARSITTTLFYLDDKKALGTKAVKPPFAPKQNKDAVEALCAKRGEPDYLLILGAPDVVPYQQLVNPLASEDDDPTVPSDLPYACKVPYNTQLNAFIGPTRVVGRLPDINGGNTTTYLINLINNAINAVPQPAGAGYFSVTASVWTVSTQLSLKSIFGNHSALMIAPPQGAAYAPGTLSNPLHFVNCHGAPLDPKFYGQSGSSYPVAMTSTGLGVGTGGVHTGCVAAFECCFGAELYPPTPTIAASISNIYLEAGALGVVASTNTAYGPAASTDWADVLCADFLKHILSGASLGRALLQARQDYVAARPVMSPTDLKTLAQFVLLGDPAVQPVVSPASPTHTFAAGMKSLGPATLEVIERSQRRTALMQMGAAVAAVTPATASSKSTPQNARKMLEALMNSETPTTSVAPDAAKGLSAPPEPMRFASFNVQGASEQKTVMAAAGMKGLTTSAGQADVIHVAVQRIEPNGPGAWYKISEVHEISGQLVPRGLGYSR